MIEELDDMSIMAYAYILQRDDKHAIIAYPFHDTNFPELFIETQDLEKTLEEVELYYKKAKTKELIDNFFTTMTKVAWAWLYIQNFLIFIIIIVGILFALTVISRAGLTDEAKLVALEIINIAKEEILSWIPFK